MVFPIDWPEPFGLVMIEAMACGTPILAFRNGSVPEVIDDGVSGRVVTSMQEAIAALPEVLAMDRRRVRATFDRRFTAARMARDYVDLYERQVKSAPAALRADDATDAAGSAGAATQPVKVLTSCPSCLQGLSRFGEDAGVEADYIVVEIARHVLGDDWMPDYVARANAGGIERVLV